MCGSKFALNFLLHAKSFGPQGLYATLNATRVLNPDPVKGEKSAKPVLVDIDIHTRGQIGKVLHFGYVKYSLQD